MRRSMTTRREDEVVDEFQLTIRALLTRLEGKSKSEEEVGRLDAIKRRLRIANSMLGRHMIVSASFPVLSKYKDKILETDTDKRDAYFSTVDIRAECVRGGMDATSDTTGLAISVLESVRRHYLLSSQTERESVIGSVKTLLYCSAEYQLGERNGWPK